MDIEAVKSDRDTGFKNLTIDEAKQFLANLIAEVERLQGKIDQIRELHSPEDGSVDSSEYVEEVIVCSECCDPNDGSSINWPCPTMQVMEEE